MIAAAALWLAVCLNPPLFGPGDVDHCAPRSRENTVCGCSEYLVWDDTPKALWWEVYRQDLQEDGAVLGAPYKVGQISKLMTIHRRHGKTRLVERLRVWFMAWDGPIPINNARYRYFIKACSETKCSEFSAQPLWYRAAPLMECWYEGDQVLCQSNG